MQRRKFVKRSLPGLAAAAGATSAILACSKDEEVTTEKEPARETSTKPAKKGKKIRWRLASSFPRGLDTIFGAAETLSDRVRALTDGRFRIRVHAAGEIVPGLEVLDAAQRGSVDITHTASYYFTGKNPALAFDTCVPFGMTARQHAAWMMQGGGSKLIQRLYSDFNVISLPGGNTGAQMGGWFKREIHSAQDLKGLKMRIPGLGGQVMNRLGATVQVLAGGDIFPALERGAIDATEWVGPYDDEKLGFQKVAKLYYYPGWWEPGPALTFQVNKKSWDELPKEFQEVLQTAAIEASVGMQVRYDHGNPAALKRLLNQGVQLKPFSRDIMKAASAASVALLEEQASKEKGYKEVYEHWKSARDDMNTWFGTAELAYAEASFKRAGG